MTNDDRPPYANSWYQVLWSKELRKREVKPLRYLGRDLVAFRGEDGVAHVLDAHCPHQGAHMGMNGCVVGNELRCPFHGWRFGGDGRCAGIPYRAEIPPGAQARSWPVCEKNGGILIYYDAHGRAPRFEVPTLAELDSRDWSGWRTNEHSFRAPLRIANETLVDYPHVKELHGIADFSVDEMRMDGHHFKAVYRMKTSLLPGSLSAWLPLHVPSTVEVNLYGAGYQIDRIKTRLMESVIISAKTPIDQHTTYQQRMVGVRATGNSAIDTLLSRFILRRSVREGGLESIVWENKRHLSDPIFCEEDGPLIQFRHWYQQFYEPVVPASAGVGRAVRS
jgi:phenylpropionate dioxygenase-like ring-hydroxylating dioxygenase large terminal subunit